MTFLEHQLGNFIVLLLALVTLWLRLPRLLYYLFKKRSNGSKAKKSPQILTQWERGHRFIKTKTMKYHYVELNEPGEGGNRNLMLCLHDQGDFWFGFRHQLRFFEENEIWIIALDLKGTGDSDKPSSTSSYRMSNIVAELSIFTEELGANHVCLVCHGSAANIGFHVASLKPKWLRKLVVIGGLHPRLAKQNAFKQLKCNRNLFYYKLPYLPEFELEMCGWRPSFGDRTSIGAKERGCRNVDNDDNEQDVLDAYNFTFCTKSDWGGVLNFYRVMPLLELQSFELEQLNDENKRINVPVLFIIGDKDPYVDLASVCRSCELISGGKSTVKVVEGAGHAPHQEQPRIVNQILTQTLSDFVEEKLPRKSSSLMRSLYQHSVGNVELRVRRVTSSVASASLSSSPSALGSAISSTVAPFVWGGLRKSLSLETLSEKGSY